MKYLLIFLCCALSLSSIAQDLNFEKGMLLDTIAVEQSPNESYALYLPDLYDKQLPSGIIFIFDPAGRGRHGIEPFIPASEKYGYILVSSNNCRNSAYDQNFNIAERWFNDVFSKFNIDLKLMYAAGFSGGSRLASTIGVSTGAFKGIVGCGAAFGNTGEMPYDSDHFHYVGLVGNKDMNYQEMLQAGEWLDQINMRNTILTFDGRHSWPPSELILKSFDWFYLNDIILGDIPLDQEFLDDYLDAQISEANSLISARKWVKGVKQYEMILKDLGPFYELDSLVLKTKHIRKTKDYKKSVKAQEKIAEEEAEWTARFVGRIDEEISLSSGDLNFKWWHRELERLKTEYLESEEQYYQDMGSRLMGMIFAVGIESLDFAMATGDMQKANYYTRFLASNWPDNAFVHYRLATAYAKMGREEKALAHLGSALENGWNNKQVILNSEEFEKLKTNVKFLELLQQLQ